MASKKMDPEIKARWVKALRDGLYKQTQRVLRTKDNHTCCLGVLCDIVDPKGWSPDPAPVHYEHDGYAALPSQRIQDKAGLTRTQLGELIDKNDGRLWSFAHIADWIEKHL